MAEDNTTATAPVERPRQFDQPMFSHLPEIDSFLWVSRARAAFDVTGAGLTAAVLDTGLNTRHVDFSGRVVAQVNLTNDNGANPDDATDGNGHGTNVGGIIVANGDHKGIAPEANICLLYTSDAADERSSGDLGGRRIIQKKNRKKKKKQRVTINVNYNNKTK